jgi:hypothetical protein
MPNRRDASVEGGRHLRERKTALHKGFELLTG